MGGKGGAGFVSSPAVRLKLSDSVKGLVERIGRCWRLIKCIFYLRKMSRICIVVEWKVRHGEIKIRRILPSHSLSFPSFILPALYPSHPLSFPPFILPTLYPSHLMDGVTFPFPFRKKRPHSPSNGSVRYAGTMKVQITVNSV